MSIVRCNRALYEKGKGVQQDKAIAREWYGKACKNGEKVGCEAYNKLNDAGLKSTETSAKADVAGVLSPKSKDKNDHLNKILDESSGGTQVVVVTVPDLGGVTLEEYAATLYRQYGIGEQENNVVLFLLSLKEGQARIEVGQGLEGVLDGAKISSIQDKCMTYLKKGDWDSVIVRGVLDLTNGIREGY